MMAKAKKNNQLIKITVRGYDVATTEEATRLVSKKVSQLKLSFSGPIPLPTKRRLWTVLISPHKHKDAQEQFERKTHKRVFFIYSNLSSSDLKSLEELKVPNTASFRLRSFF